MLSVRENLQAEITNMANKAKTGNCWICCRVTKHRMTPEEFADTAHAEVLTFGDSRPNMLSITRSPTPGGHPDAHGGRQKGEHRVAGIYRQGFRLLCPGQQIQSP